MGLSAGSSYKRVLLVFDGGKTSSLVGSSVLFACWLVVVALAGFVFVSFYVCGCFWFAHYTAVYELGFISILQRFSTPI
jgi:hypothetical protein